MGRNRFIVSGTKRIELSDGDWIEIKESLNTGETKALESAGEAPPVLVKDADGRNQVVERIDWKRYEIERVFIFLTDWSFNGKDGKPVKVSMDAIASLDPESFSEISAAVLKQILANAAEARAKKAVREAQKSSSLPSTNGKTGTESDSTATS